MDECGDQGAVEEEPVETRQLRIVTLRNTMVTVPLVRGETWAALKLRLESANVMGSYEAIIQVRGEVVADAELVENCPRLVWTGQRPPQVILAKRAFAGAIARCVQEHPGYTAPSPKMFMGQDVHLALRVKDYVLLKHNRDQEYAMAQTRLGAEGRVTLAFLEHISCTPFFVERLKARPCVRTGFTTLPADVMRTLFRLLTSHNDFLRFRSVCRFVFIASTEPLVRSRVDYLTQKAWDALKALPAWMQ